MENKSIKYDLEDRLVDFACMCLEVCELLPNSKAGQNLEYQLSKSELLPPSFMGRHRLLNREQIFCIK